MNNEYIKSNNPVKNNSSDVYNFVLEGKTGEIEINTDVETSDIEMVSDIENNGELHLPERQLAENMSTPTVKEELQQYLIKLYNLFTPTLEKQKYIIWLPILVSILSCVYFITLLMTRFFCPEPHYESVCTKLLIEIPFGGFYVKLARQPSFRWITYSFYHFTWIHLLMNLLMLVPSLYFMERKYGSVRMFILYLVGSVGGSVFSWWLLPDEAVVAGASAAIYGYIFLYLADLILNWFTVKTPRFQITFVIAALIALIIEGAIQRSLSVIAHIGGGLGTLWFSLLILPRFYHMNYEWIVPVISIVFMLLQFLVLPLVLFYCK
mgnify:CR=1 FL=1